MWHSVFMEEVVDAEWVKHRTQPGDSGLFPVLNIILLTYSCVSELTTQPEQEGPPKASWLTA